MFFEDVGAPTNEVVLEVSEGKFSAFKDWFRWRGQAASFRAE
jgi:hypothetical protein